MKVLRLLALAGMLTMVFPLTSLAGNNTAQQKKNVQIADQVVLAGKTLAPGQYKVEWQGNGPNVKVNFMKSGKTVLTAPAKVAQLKTKVPYDAVVESTRKNGTKTISEIEWNNQSEALMFGAQAHPGLTHHTSKRASSLHTTSSQRAFTGPLFSCAVDQPG
jgi:hypothetical protein